MDESSLTEALEVALERLHEISIATPDASIDMLGGHRLTEEPLVTEIREAGIDHELAKIVLPTLEVQPEFRDKALMIKSPRGKSGFQSQFVAPLLVREARHRKSARAAVTWLAKVLRTDSGAGLAIQTLWGISPAQRIPLLEDVDLLPFESLPPSRQKEQLTNIDWPQNIFLPTPFFTREPPTAALVAKTEVRPFLIDASQEENSPDNSVPQVIPPLDDIRLCLALEDPTIIIPGLGWFQYVDPDLEAAIIPILGGYSNQEVLPFGLLEDSLVSATDVQAIVRAYMALESEDIKKKIRIALERLHQALIRSDPADRTLELSIALEALLITSAGEHTFKLSYRAALLVSEKVEERIETRAMIEAAYGIRSALMHKGHVEPVFKVKGQGKKPVEEVASRAAKITALVIKRIIMKGGFPEWNRFELSDGRIWK